MLFLICSFSFRGDHQSLCFRKTRTNREIVWSVTFVFVHFFIRIQGKSSITLLKTERDSLYSGCWGEKEINRDNDWFLWLVFDHSFKKTLSWLIYYFFFNFYFILFSVNKFAKRSFSTGVFIPFRLTDLDINYQIIALIYCNYWKF